MLVYFFVPSFHYIWNYGTDSTVHVLFTYLQICGLTLDASERSLALLYLATVQALVVRSVLYYCLLEYTTQEIALYTASTFLVTKDVYWAVVLYWVKSVCSSLSRVNSVWSNEGLTHDCKWYILMWFVWPHPVEAFLTYIGN